MEEIQASQASIAPLDEISDMSLQVDPLEHSTLIRVIGSAVKLASDLTTADFGASIKLPNFSGRSLSLAGVVATQSVNALLAAAAGGCNILIPEEDVEAVMTAAGEIIYRCYHVPPHEWDLAGHRK